MDVKDFSSRSLANPKNPKTMIAERERDAVDYSCQPSNSRRPRIPKPRRRGSKDEMSPQQAQSPTLTEVTTIVETHLAHGSPKPKIGQLFTTVPSSPDKPLTSNGTGIDMRKHSHKERKPERIPADTPERRLTCSEDESLHSAESQEKEKSPVDEYLAITMPSTPSDDPTEAIRMLAEEPKKAKSRSSLMKKWKKKVTESFSTKSSLEKDEELGEKEVVPEVLALVELPKKLQDTQHSIAFKDETKPIKKKRTNKETKALPEDTTEGTSQIPVPPPAAVLLSPSSKRSLRRREKAREFIADEKILGIKIHHTDLLPTDPNTCHPVVRVSITDEDGNYLIKSCNEASATENFLKESTLTKSSIEPVMTRPSLVTGSGFCRLLPKWEEMLVITEPLEKFLKSPQVIIFFEVMDFVPMGHQSLRKKKQFDLGWYKIAWGFLKPLGVNGTRHINRKLRLQLYRPDFGKGERVYKWWRSKRRMKLNSTLYVTLKGILPPEAEHKSSQASVSTLMSMKKAELTEALIEGQLAMGQRVNSNESEANGKHLRKVPQWKRFPGQSCKVPNKLLKSLPVSEIDSFNFRVMGNVQCVKFSPCGLLLATGLSTTQYHVILIFEIPSGKLLKSLRGHHGLIYELDWTQLNNSEYSLVSASADSTARVWKLETNDTGIKAMSHSVLLHPSYVYTAEFSPIVPSFLVTGCYDTAIRLWKLKTLSISLSDTQVLEDSAPLFLLNGHRSHINCIRFHPNGEVLFSADGRGTLCEWRLPKGKQKLPPRLEKETKLVSIGHVAITSLCVDGTGRKLLVQLCQSCLKILDVETFLVLNTFDGLTNERFRLQSVLSPCGNLVLSGSEDSALYIWDTDTGRLLAQIRPGEHPNCVVSSVTYHPFDHYVAIGLLSSTEEQQPILFYTFEYPAGISVGTISKISTMFGGSRSRHSHDEIPQKIQLRGDTLKRTDISEKFQSILQKLDEVTEGTPQLATVTAQLMEESRLLVGKRGSNE